MGKNGVQLVLRKVEYDGFKFEIMAIGDPGEMKLFIRIHNYEWGTFHEYKEDSIYYNLFSALGGAVQNALDELRVAKRDARGCNDINVERCEYELAGLIDAVKAICEVIL